MIIIPGGIPFWHRLGDDSITIGSGEETGLILTGEGVSRKHAEIVPKNPGKWAIHDLDSTNGTFINGQPILSSDLVEGDIITLGKTHVIFFESSRK
ncbi:MAG: FHA domain-containing protein [Lentisphaeria bacterium]|nr:FHA domain-containing protein [Lentisphaeria bacterium]